MRGKHHLPEDPCHHFSFAFHVLEDEAIVLLGKIEHNIRRLEGRERAVSERVIDDHGDLAVGVAGGESRGELGIRHDVNHMRIIVDAKLLQQDAHLLTVGGSEGVELQWSIALR